MIPDLGPYAGFILFAFGATFLVLAAMIGESVLALRAAKMRLAEAERALGENRMSGDSKDAG